METEKGEFWWRKMQIETEKGTVLGQSQALSLFHNSHKNVGYSTLASWMRIYFTLAPCALKSWLPRWMNIRVLLYPGRSICWFRCP